MNRKQRFILILYFLLLAANCLYVPWRVEPAPGVPTGAYPDTFYAALWHELPSQVGAVYQQPAKPHLQLIALHGVVLTALAGAAFVIAGFPLKKL